MNGSPWQDAGTAFSGIGDSIGRAVLMMAQQRWQEQERMQERAYREQQMELKRKELESQERMYKSHMGLYDAQAAEASARASINKARVDAANSFGSVLARAGLGPVEAPEQPGLASLNPELGGTTVPYEVINQVQEGDNTMEANRLAGVIAALAGQPERAANFETKNMANRSVGPRMDPKLARMILTGTKSAVPVGHQGGVYDPFKEAISAVMPQTGSAGSLISPGTTGIPSVQVPNRPITVTGGVNPQRNLGSLGNILKSVLVNGTPPEPSEATYGTFTNVLSQIAQTLPLLNQSGTNQSAAPIAQGMRKVGDVVTTQKGTFRWNGQSWDPVTQ